MNDNITSLAARAREALTHRRVTVDDQIEEIAGDIRASIAATYKDEPVVTIDKAAIRVALESCFYIGKGKWLMMLGENGFPVVFSGVDAKRQ